MSDEVMTPAEFLEGIGVMTWDFADGSQIEITSYPEGGYSLCGNIGGHDIHDEDHEDFHFADSDALLDWLKAHNLLRVLSQAAQSDQQNEVK